MTDHRRIEDQAVRVRLDERIRTLETYTKWYRVQAWLAASGQADYWRADRLADLRELRSLRTLRRQALRAADRVIAREQDSLRAGDFYAGVS